MTCARGGTAAPYRASGLVLWPDPEVPTAGPAGPLIEVDLPCQRRLILVESRCGAVSVGRTYPFPPLSSGGALVVRPWLRFHIPLIEPDVQISRIRLSDKTSRVHPRLVAAPRSQADETKVPVEGPQSDALVQSPLEFVDLPIERLDHRHIGAHRLLHFDVKPKSLHRVCRQSLYRTATHPSPCLAR